MNSPKRTYVNRTTKSMFLRLLPEVDAKIRKSAVRNNCTFAEVVEQKFLNELTRAELRYILDACSFVKDGETFWRIPESIRDKLESMKSKQIET